MRLFDKMNLLSLATPVITRPRICFAVAVAAITDFLQLLLGPFGWLWLDQGLDVVAMVLTSAAIGFHPLLLPTFVLEFLPVVDMLPSWTACTAAVIMLRRKSTVGAPPPSPPPPSSESGPGGPPIDVTAEVTRVPPKL